MHDPADTEPDDAADAELLAACAEALLAAAVATVPGWAERLLVGRLEAAGIDAAAQPWPDLVAATVAATTDDVLGRLRALLDADVDEQQTTPLQVLRASVRFSTEVLDSAGLAAVRRDEWEERSFPADRYALAPAALADVDPALHEPGLVWGAAKAHVVLARRRREGRM